MAATFDTTEQRILKIIDDNRETIVEFARDIYDHAELGYKEFRTSKKFVDFMKSLQLPVQTDLAITGAKAYLNKEKAGNASLALIGELDALRIPQHAHANQETQAAHCCGHHAQLAGVSLARRWGLWMCPKQARSTPAASIVEGRITTSCPARKVLPLSASLPLTV